VLDPLRFNLLVFGTPTAELAAIDFADLVRVHAVPTDVNADALARAGIPDVAFYLLRPDGHVGLCGGSLERTDVVTYLRENVKLVAHDAAIGPSSESGTSDSP